MAGSNINSKSSKKANELLELQQLRKHTRQFMHNINAEQNKNKTVRPVSPPPFHYFASTSSSNRQPRKSILKHNDDMSNEQVLSEHKVKKANFANIPPPPAPLVQTLPRAASNMTRRNTMTEYFEGSFTRQHSLSPDKFSPRLAAPLSSTSGWKEPIDVLSDTRRKLSLKVDEVKKKNTKFIFQKSEDYFDELQKYRLENPQLFYKYAPNNRSGKDRKSDTSISHEIKDDESFDNVEDGEECQPVPLGGRIHSHEEPKITDGYFTLDERYYPYSVAQQADIVSSGVENSYRQLFQLEDLGAVKISIPKSHVHPVQRNLKPAARRDYDPGDSMSLSKYLAAGYAPIASAKPAKGSQNISFRRIQTKNKRMDLLAPL